MKDSFLENENILLKHINTIDLILKSLYEKKSTIEKAFSQFSNSIDIHFLPDKMMTQENVIKICHNFIKREFKKMNEKIKGKSTLKNVIYDFNSLIKHAKDFNKGRKYIQFIELIGNLIFNSNGINCDFNNETKTKKEKIECYLIYEAKSLIENKTIKKEDINKFLQLNHLLFLINDNFKFSCLQFFLIITLIFSEKYGQFDDYYEFLLYFYYIYYKFIKEKNLYVFIEEVLSNIDSDNYSKFLFNNIELNQQIMSLTIKLENIIFNNKKFVLKCNKNLLNSPFLLDICHLNKIDFQKIENFFRFSTIQANYLKYSLHKDREFDICVDDLIYDNKKLHVFNIFFIIACGLADHIEKESLQIFNGDNQVIKLFKKYAQILIDKINEAITKIKNNSNIINDEDEDEENFGFGKIYDTFYVLYTNLLNDDYEQEKLKFDLDDTFAQKNIEKKTILKININMNKNDCDTNFTISSKGSNSNKIENTQSYYEKVNSDALEDGCKKYILSKIEELIVENEDKIEIIELYKILFSLNFYIPYVDENYSLKFIHVVKNLNILGEDKKYGYHEFDFLFKVCSDHDIPINEKTGDKALLPFIKCNQITIECENIFDYKISFENKKLFCLNKNSLVIVENKIKFPSKKEDLMKYTFLLLKKLNIVIKLIKNTTKNIKNYESFQLLLIYDDILFDTEEIKNTISESEFNKLLESIPFTEKVKISFEIIYVSQVKHIFNISRAFKKIHKLENRIKILEDELSQMKANMKEKK